MLIKFENIDSIFEKFKITSDSFSTKDLKMLLERDKVASLSNKKESFYIINKNNLLYVTDKKTFLRMNLF